MKAHLKSARVAFQGEPGAFSEAAAIQLLGESITTVPRPTFDSAFAAISEGAADVLLAPVENTLAGSVVRVYDLLLESNLSMVAETILHIEHQLIGTSRRHARRSPLRLFPSQWPSPNAKFFSSRIPDLKRVPTEDTAGSVREVIARGDKSFAGIAARRAAKIYGGEILAENIHDNPENFTRFVLLVPETLASQLVSPTANKMSIALRLAHKPGALLAALEPFSRHGVNLQKIESRPIHGRPFEYQFYLDIEASSPEAINAALAEVRSSTTFLRTLGLYPSASRS